MFYNLIITAHKLDQKYNLFAVATLLSYPYLPNSRHLQSSKKMYHTEFKDYRANSVATDEAVHCELLHLNPCCLRIQLLFISGGLPMSTPSYNDQQGTISTNLTLTIFLRL